VRPAGFAKEFAKKLGIPKVAKSIDEMADDADAAIIHSANWDVHLERAKPFVDRGKPVLLDKPIVGNLKDARTLIDWTSKGAVVAGGSSLRWCFEVRDLLAQRPEDLGEIHAVVAGCGVDEFNYGIHAYSLAAGILGPGVASARHLGKHVQEQAQITWKDGRQALLIIGETPKWIPFYATVVTTQKVVQFEVDAGKLYRALLEHDLPILEKKAPPVPMRELLAPELAAIAVKSSKEQFGDPVAIDELDPEEEGYDGKAFETSYREKQRKK
jgi:hypothetical protein